MKAFVSVSVLMQGYSHQVLNTIFSGVAQNSLHFARLFSFFAFCVELDELSKIQNAVVFGIKETFDA